LSCQKRVGEVGESESALDDVFGIRVITVELRYVAKTYVRKHLGKTLETTLKLSDQMSEVGKKTFDFLLCSFGFV